MSDRTERFPGLVLTMSEQGAGRPVLVLHGGGGPAMVAGIVAHLAPAMQVLAPTHPGWNGTPRPEGLDRIATLARVYLDWLAARGFRDVVVIGSSIGGWLAAEMAAQDRAGIVGSLVVINGTGIEVAEAPMPDFFALDARGIAEHSYYDPERFVLDPATLPPERVAMMRANIATLKLFAAEPYMHDPSLAGRLAEITVPTLLIWGESDRIVTPAYGMAFAKAIPAARFVLVPRAGHLPHFEQPETVYGLIDGFVTDRPAAR